VEKIANLIYKYILWWQSNIYALQIERWFFGGLVGWLEGEFNGKALLL
jgi:hypothetical protein